MPELTTNFQSSGCLKSRRLKSGKQFRLQNFQHHLKSVWANLSEIRMRLNAIKSLKMESRLRNIPDCYRIFSFLNTTAINNEKLLVWFCRVVRCQESCDQQELGVKGQLNAQTRWLCNWKEKFMCTQLDWGDTIC